MNVDILKDAKNKLTSKILQNIRVFILVMSMSQFELTLPLSIKIVLKLG